MNTCKKCTSKISDKKFVICEICITYFHMKCLKFGESEYQVLSAHDGICYLCDACRENPTLSQFKELKKQTDLLQKYICKIDKAVQEQKVPFNSIETELTCVKNDVKCTESHVMEMKESVRVTKNLVKQLKQSDASIGANSETATSSKKSYSSVLKSVCVIKPKDEKQKRDITKQMIKEKIDPVDLSVSGLRNVGAAGIAIVCDNPQSLNEVKSIAEQKMSEHYEIVIPKPILPRVKISGLEEKHEKDSIKQKILAQNDLPKGPNEDISILAVRDTKKGRYFDAFVEMSPGIYKFVMETGRLKIGWNVCHVVDAMEPRRCARCCSYDHLAKKCTSKNPYCLKCGHYHDVKDCNIDEVNCINCIRANREFKLQLDFTHCANDKNCPVFQRANNRLREKISF